MSFCILLKSEDVPTDRSLPPSLSCNTFLLVGDLFSKHTFFASGNLLVTCYELYVMFRAPCQCRHVSISFYLFQCFHCSARRLSQFFVLTTCDLKSGRTRALCKCLLSPITLLSALAHCSASMSLLCLVGCL